jgi:N6-L-threonylcarbamoyladenine synthase
MRILSIETSCDETALSITQAHGDATDPQIKVRATALASQVEQHAPYGGVYPDIAKREHTKNLAPLLNQVLTDAGMYKEGTPQLTQETLGEIKEMLSREPELFARLATFFAQIQQPPIDAIAVTTGPGLDPALWTGVNCARALAQAWQIPVIPVNHMEGHIVAGLFSEDGTYCAPTYPLLSLLVSGGHTELILARTPFTYEYIGQTRDDAVGEAFDKVARLLELPYPGGPAISKLAQQARDEQLEQTISLPRPMTQSGDFDFSFSGIKTAVRYIVQSYETLDEHTRKQLAREFEDAALDSLLVKTDAALEQYDPETLVLGGGVAANLRLQVRLRTLVNESHPGVELKLPPVEMTTDNALMIALAAHLRYMHGGTECFSTPQQVSTNPNAVLSTDQ